MSPPNAATLALLQRYHPELPQDEIVQRYHRTVGLLSRQLREAALQRLNDNMLGAVVSFCLDLGLPFFAQSTLRHRLNSGRLLEAIAQFPGCHSRQGKPDKIMKQRRQAEAYLFCSFTA